MLRKFTLFALSLLCVFNLMAQSNNDRVRTKALPSKSIITYPASDVQFWCGSGTNSAIIVVGFDDATTPVAYVWGVRFNGSAVVTDLFDSIMAYDSRVSYTMSGSLLTEFTFNNGADTPTGYSDWWCYKKDDVWCTTYDAQAAVDGDVFVMSTDCSWTLNLSDAIPVTDPNVGPTPPTTNPVEADIANADILYWVGTGSNTVRFIANWADPDTALAWGYRFGSDSVSVSQMITDIAAADPRLTLIGSSSFVTDLIYTDGTTTLQGLDYSYWMYNVNGEYAPDYMNNIYLHNGDMAKFGDMESATVLTWDYGYPATYVWEHAVTPVSVPVVTPPTPDPVDATIAESDILYWVGTGSNSARFIVNWADTCLAWGYHFNGSSVNLINLMDSISAADPRFSYHLDWGFVDSINYVENGRTFAVTPNHYFSINKNGVYTEMSADIVSVANGEYIKFGDETVSTWLDSTWYGSYWAPTNMVWEAPVHPVSVPAVIDDPDTIQAVEADIANADILYWVGSGSNTARFIANWADTALAWGYRFSQDSVSVYDMMAAIETADPRFSIEGGSFIYNIFFTENGTTHMAGNDDYWMFNVNGVGAPSSADMVYIHNADMAKFGVASDATITATFEWDGVVYPSAMVWERTVYPVSVPAVIDDPDTNQAEEATIAESDILFWIGQGIHNYTLIVNWADTALAWGYRSWIDSVSVKEVMDQVMVNDPRFSYVAAGGFVNDIYFVENGDTLAITPGQYWSYNVNGSAAQNLYTSQYLHDHDMAKWGDPSVAVVLDSSEWGGVWYPTEQVWTMTVHPASVVEPEHGPFCGAVGSEGCNAVPATDNTIVAWAAACTLDLGYQNIAAQGPRVSYGEAADAVGACDLDDNLSVVSLGDGGSATLTFDGHIYNGDGPDFAVYENGFDDSFLELAFVEVSSDGEHFVRFPATSLTQTTVQVGGIGTVDPTNINNLAGKYRHGWGTPFDLDDLRDSANLDINHITHVRIVDVVGSIDPQYASYDAFGHIVNDPWPTESYSSGFDLDGVAVMHLSNETESIDETVAEISLYPNPANDRVRISYGMGETFTAIVYDLSGREVMTRQGSGVLTLNVATLPGGVYMVRIADQVQKLVVRH